jgi:hypothetical protein
MARKLSYPWSVLGIEPTSEEIDIKRAYAARLKVTRPEDDSEAFQDLVQARDFALERTKRKKAKKTERNPVTKSTDPIKPEVVSKTRRRNPAKHIINVDSASSTRNQSDAASAQSIELALKFFFESNGAGLSFAGAKAAVKDLKKLGIEEKIALEDKILAIVSNALPSITENQFSIDPRLKNHSRNQGSIVYGLDEEFGWTQNDRRISNEKALENEHFVDQLQLLLNPDRRPQVETQKFHLTWWQKAVGIFFLLQVVAKIYSAIAGNGP